VAHRPGAPALTLVLEGALGRTVIEATAALEICLGVSIGLAAAALVRDRGRSTWLLVGTLAGTFAVHLSAGYLANVLQVAVFLAAAVCLSAGTRRGAVLAAVAVASGALAHPPFAAVGSGILLLAAALAWRTDRRSALREGIAVVGGSAVGAAALWTMPSYPPRPLGDTSRDAFLRRTGLTGELRSSYLDRLVRRWARYVQWVSVPLAVLGWGEANGFVGRFLRSWAIATVAGIGAGLVSGRVPPDRLVTFGFVVPILAGLGLIRLARLLEPRRAVAGALVGASTFAMLAGAAITWDRQEPFLAVDEVGAARAANAIAAGLDPGTPLAFLVNTTDGTGAFLAARAANVLRAAMPPDRIRDVVVVVPPLDGLADEERAALERVTADDLRRAERRSGRPATTFLLRPFNQLDGPGGVIVIDGSASGAGAVDPLRPAAPTGIVGSGLLALGWLAATGYGWARAVGRDSATALALAPGLGASVLALTAVGLARSGLLLDDPAGAWLVSAVAGGGGYLAWWILQRLTRPRPANEVDE
jgi:hypothetical protein